MTYFSCAAIYWQYWLNAFPIRRMRMMGRFLLIAILIFLFQTTSAHAWGWKFSPEAAGELGPGEVVNLRLTEPGKMEAVSDPFAVKAGSDQALTFRYRGLGLDTDTRLTVLVRWLDAGGKDIDEEGLTKGTPLLLKVHQFSRAPAEFETVAWNVSVPSSAVSGRVEFRLDRLHRGSPAQAEIKDLQWLEKAGEPVGVVDLLSSGPVDAGDFSSESQSGNLVLDGTFEQEGNAPKGWHIEGNNELASADWADGGSFSGRRSLRIWDRGPFVASWGRTADEPYVPGGPDNGNFGMARREVAARWVSDFVPVEAGQVFQAYFFTWYGARPQNDRWETSPVRLRFYDSKGQVIAVSPQSDWLPNMKPFDREGWIPVFTKPYKAPPNAVKMRAEIALTHAFYEKSEFRSEREFVLVDNLAVYRLNESDASQPTDETIFLAAAEAGRVPAVPFSLRHHPGALTITTAVAQPGGVLLLDPQDAQKPQTLEAGLSLRNWLPAERQVSINYQLVSVEGKSLSSGEATITLKPFAQGTVNLPLQGPLAYGPYELKCEMKDAQGNTETTATRLSIMPREFVSAEERARLDYPFGMWIPYYAKVLGTPQAEEMGFFTHFAGVGKTWYGINVFLGRFLKMPTSEERKAALKAQIQEAKPVIAMIRSHGVTPMGMINPPEGQIPDPQITSELVTLLISELKEDISMWNYRMEYPRSAQPAPHWELYEKAYAAAKSADGDCLFGVMIGPGMDIALKDFFEMTNGKGKLDAVGMVGSFSPFASWKAVVDVLKENGLPDLPLYDYESRVPHWTLPTGPNYLSNEVQGSIRQLNYWTTLLNEFPQFFHWEQKWLRLEERDVDMTQGNLARPQLLGFATMTRMLGAGQFVKSYHWPNAILHVRERSVRKGLVGVISSKFGTETVEIQVKAPFVTVTDLWGNATRVATKNGIAHLNVTTSPQYLDDVPEMSPAPGLERKIVHATQKSGESSVNFIVENNRPQPVRGTISLGEGAEPVTSGTIAPGEQKTFRFTVPSPDLKLDQRTLIEGKFITDDGETFITSAGMNFHTASRTSSIRKIDGELEDWPKDGFLILNRQDQVNSWSTKAWGGLQDLSAKVWLSWDEENLYLIAVVQDDVHSPAQKPGMEFKFDAIEMLIDVNRGLSRDSSFQMFTLAFIADQPLIQRYEGPLPPGAVKGARLVVRRENGQTIYEAALPWSDIARGFKPKIGQTISIALSIDDNDAGTSGRRCISWFSPVNAKTPEMFGDITLTE